MEAALESSPSYMSKMWPAIPGHFSADNSPEDKITIPGTTVNVLDSEPIFSALPQDSNDFSQISFKLVGYGHGTFHCRWANPQVDLFKIVKI
jgi:hypothetical protein